MSIQGLCLPSELTAGLDDEAFLLQLCFDPRQQTLNFWWDIVCHTYQQHIYMPDTPCKKVVLVTASAHILSELAEKLKHLLNALQILISSIIGTLLS